MLNPANVSVAFEAMDKFKTVWFAARTGWKLAGAMTAPTAADGTPLFQFPGVVQLVVFAFPVHVVKLGTVQPEVLVSVELFAVAVPGVSVEKLRLA